MRIFGYEVKTHRSATQYKFTARKLSAQPPAAKQIAVTGVSTRSGKKMSGAPDKHLKQAIAGTRSPNRTSKESPESFADVSSIWYAFSKRKANAKLGLQSSFDIKDFENLDFDLLTELLSDLSPEISKALWDFLLLCNPGYELKAFKLGTTDVDERAQQYINDVIEPALDAQHGTLGVFFDRLFKMLFLRGSILLELIPDANGRDFLGIASPDTRTLEFRRIDSEQLGQVWDFGQNQDGKFVSLRLPTVSYIPIHPSPDSIEGHSLCSSALFAAIFIMAVLRDTKRVVQHQGYMRLDVKVLFDKLKDTMPEEARLDSAKAMEWMNEIITAVRDVYESLEPDDTYVHSDTIEVGSPVGTVSADALQGIDSLFQALERMLVRALKTMPLLLATNASRSETQANREWEIYAKGIETIQHYVEKAFQHVVKLALRMQGFQVDVKLRFEQFRAAEKMRDVQVDYWRSRTARINYDNGFISQDEAAQYAVGKDVADVSEPRASADLSGAPDGGVTVTENPNPGEARMRDLMTAGVRQPSLTDVNDAQGVLERFAPGFLSDLFIAEVAEEEL